MAPGYHLEFRIGPLLWAQPGFRQAVLSQIGHRLVHHFEAQSTCLLQFRLEVHLDSQRAFRPGFQMKVRPDSRVVLLQGPVLLGYQQVRSGYFLPIRLWAFVQPVHRLMFRFVHQAGIQLMIPQVLRPVLQLGFPPGSQQVFLPDSQQVALPDSQ